MLDNFEVEQHVLCVDSEADRAGCDDEDVERDPVAEVALGAFVPFSPSMVYWSELLYFDESVTVSGAGELTFHGLN